MNGAKYSAKYSDIMQTNEQGEFNAKFIQIKYLFARALEPR